MCPCSSLCVEHVSDVCIACACTYLPVKSLLCGICMFVTVVSTHCPSIHEHIINSDFLCLFVCLFVFPPNVISVKGTADNTSRVHEVLYL